MTQRDLLYMEREERLALAQDPVTPPELLRMLFEDACFWRQPTGYRICGTTHDYELEETEVADALAVHPNTPSDILVALALKRPAAFGRNPVASLLPLERPDLILNLQRKDPGRLLRQPEVPLAFVQIIATQSENPAYRREAELHVALSGEAGPDWRETLRAALTAESRTSVQMQDPRAAPILRALAAVGCAPAYLLPDGEPPFSGAEPQPGDVEAAVRTALALNTDQEWSTDLCRCLALAHTTDTEHMLRYGFARSLKWLERLGVALNPSPGLVDKVMPELSEDGNRLIRAAARARLYGETIPL